MSNDFIKHVLMVAMYICVGLVGFGLLMIAWSLTVKTGSYKWIIFSLLTMPQIVLLMVIGIDRLFAKYWKES